MRVLVTNDDGVTAPGLAHLAAGIGDLGYELTIAAPLREASGAGAGVGPIHTMGDGIVVERFTLPDLEHIPTFGLDALPALIVLTACLGAFGPPPDVIVSGINPGRNVGRAALHSGTVGAALTAVHFNKRALAVSIQAGAFSGFESGGKGGVHFETAAAVAASLLPQLAGAPVRTVLNCNVPNLPLGAVRGIRQARLSRTGLVRSALVDESAGTRMQLELGFAEPKEDDDTDEALSLQGYVTVTALASVTEDARAEVRESTSQAVSLTSAGLGLACAGTEQEADGPAA